MCMWKETSARNAFKTSCPQKQAILKFCSVCVCVRAFMNTFKRPSATLTH